MKKWICEIMFFLLVVASMTGCGIFKKAQRPENITQYTYIDSLVIKDSIRVVDLPVERIVDIVPDYDTLEMETSLAKSKSWVDTTSHTLRGEIENKPQAKIKVPYKEHIVFRDSISIKEVPVPYEVIKKEIKYPLAFWILLAFAALMVGVCIPSIVKFFKAVKTVGLFRAIFPKKNKVKE